MMTIWERHLLRMLLKATGFGCLRHCLPTGPERISSRIELMHMEVISLVQRLAALDQGIFLPRLAFPHLSEENLKGPLSKHSFALLQLAESH